MGFLFLVISFPPVVRIPAIDQKQVLGIFEVLSNVVSLKI